MTRPDLDVMEAVAKGATEVTGPVWEMDDNTLWFGEKPLVDASEKFADTGWESPAQQAAINAYLLATQPAAILELIAYIRELEGARDNITGQLLYEAFWRRNRLPDPVPYFKQAPAIIAMWNEIAADARTALRTTGGE